MVQHVKIHKDTTLFMDIHLPPILIFVNIFEVRLSLGHLWSFLPHAKTLRRYCFEVAALFFEDN
jgi:hypothetical protein